MISNESYLIQLARQSNSAASSQLYDRHYDAVFRYCYYHVGNVETAQDLTGEVFVRMARNLDVIDVHRRPLLTWLYAIAYSLITLSFNEQHLVRRVRQGDPVACSQLYDRYYDVIYRYCYYYAGNRALAQDLTGKVFVQMAKQLDRFKERNQSLLAWLYTLAHKLIADTYRRNGHGIRLPLEDTITINPVTGNRVERRLSAENLAVALTHLTEEQRQVILFQFLEDHTSAKVASLMGTSEEALKSQSHHALAALEHVLKEHPYYGQ